jgi:hypothetical protein
MTHALTPTPNGDMCLTSPDPRGANLARALKARCAPVFSAFYLTPARAFKWETLHAAGWDARQTNAGRLVSRAWVFFHPSDRTALHSLTEAMRRVEAQTAGIAP